MTIISATPSVIDLELVKDADTTFEFTLTDGRSEVVDITADGVRLTVRDKIGGTQKVQKTNATGSHSDPTHGKTQFKIENTDIIDTLTDASTAWVYEIRRLISGGDEAVHIMGDFIVHLAVGD